jgi:hypothetical protein
MSGRTVLGPAASDAPGAEISPIPLLDAIQDEGRPWQELAPRYGVANPDPPWKVTLYAIFECLSAGGALPSLERRHIEDRLGETIYGRTPDPRTTASGPGRYAAAPRHPERRGPRPPHGCGPRSARKLLVGSPPELFERCRVFAGLDPVDGILSLGISESRRARSSDECPGTKD